MRTKKKQQITLTLTVKIWAEGRRRLPKDIGEHLEGALTHAAEQVAQDFVCGEILPVDEKLRGFWEVEIK